MMEECDDCGLETVLPHATDADCLEALKKERAAYRMALTSIVDLCSRSDTRLSQIHMFATCGLNPPKGPP
jgi:hypothetical protein